MHGQNHIKDNNKIDLREVKLKGVHWIHLAQERENCRAVLNMEIDPFSFKKKRGLTATLS